MKNAKELMSEVISKLNTAGFTGGFYHYKDGECSCCYGLEKAFFEVNENIPQNWAIYGTSKFHYKFSYNLDDSKKAGEFRKIANKLVKKYFGKLAETAKNNFQAIVVNVN